MFINNKGNGNSAGFFRDGDGKYKSDEANYFKMQNLLPHSRAPQVSGEENCQTKYQGVVPLRICKSMS